MRQTLLLSFLAFLSTLPVARALAQPKPPRAGLRGSNVLEPCRGKVTTVVAFIVTGCPHCKAFTRDVLEPLYEAKRVCAVAIAFDVDEADTARFSRDQKLTFPVFKLERKVVREFLGVSGEDHALGTPQVVVIDKFGIIQAQQAPRRVRLCCCSRRSCAS